MFIKCRRTVKYGTELSFFRNGIVFGPGNPKYAHTDDEQVMKSEVAKAARLYEKMRVLNTQKIYRVVL
jgi:acetylornithine deacetylase/succinyl-diaminopimelate desuccinylase-like protein